MLTPDKPQAVYDDSTKGFSVARHPEFWESERVAQYLIGGATMAGAAEVSLQIRPELSQDNLIRLSVHVKYQAATI